MTGDWIAPDQIFDGRNLLSGKAVRVTSGQIVEIDDTPSGAIKISGLMSPGYVDLQVNGGGGLMVNSSPTPGGIRCIAAAHRRFGTVALMPTVITDHPDVLDSAVDAIISLRESQGILGLHIEGPHISEAQCGTHSCEFIRPMDTRTFQAIARLRSADQAVLITVAPEAITLDQIAMLTIMGAVVSLGHTDADTDQINAAIKAGASCGTHLFNAMSPMRGRAPGAVGAIINSLCYAGIICDGHHVADEMVGMTVRARPSRDLMFLVSDAMATVGGPNQFDLYSQTIYLNHGKLINAKGGLAGAHTTQADGLRRLVNQTGTSLVDALRMTTSTPAKCIGNSLIGGLLNRRLEDVIILDPELCVGDFLDIDL
jgi:N-acetylglucosamine-6-phosphate deacetylase